MSLVIVNKVDLPRKLDLTTLSEILGGLEAVETSAAQSGGTDKLEEKLAELVLSGNASPRPGDAVITSVRHRDALKRAEEHLQSALNGASLGTPAAFIAVDLRSALNALGEITGETVGEDLLDEIFRNFCIGK